MPLTPEQQARQEIDAALAGVGWIVQDRDEMNLAAGLGVAVREFRMAPGHGFADYMLFVDGQAVGVLEAKPVGYTLSSVELQADKYAAGLPAGLNPPVNPLPFLYVGTGVDTRFINGAACETPGACGLAQSSMLLVNARLPWVAAWMPGVEDRRHAERWLSTCS